MKLSYFKSIFLLALTGSIFLTGCQKDNPAYIVPKTLDELQASDSFTWTTGGQVEFSFEGIETMVPIKSALRISLSDGTVLFSSFHQMDQNLVVSLPVPSQESILIMKYGSKVYPLEIQNGKAEFSFLSTSN